MGNPLPRHGGKIYNLATKMYNGIVAKGAGVPVTMVTATQMLASKSAFKTAQDNFNAARNDLREGYLVFTPAMAALSLWLATARTVLGRILGERWSAAWAEAGFTQPSTGVPRTIDGQIALGLSLVTYFTNNPDKERADMNVTAAQATTLTDVAVNGRSGVSTAEEALKTAKQVLDPAKADLLDLMSTLVSNLDKKLPADDPRWLAFGLRMPSTPVTPGKPQNVTATLTSDGTILVQCDRDPLADRYRGRMLIVGAETKYRLVFSGTEPMGTITDVEPGTTVQIIMQAVNQGYQSVASDPVVFTVLPAAKPATDPDLAPLAAVTPGNGAGNGNGHGSSLVGSRS